MSVLTFGPHLPKTQLPGVFVPVRKIAGAFPWGEETHFRLQFVPVFLPFQCGNGKLLFSLAAPCTRGSDPSQALGYSTTLTSRTLSVGCFRDDRDARAPWCSEVEMSRSFDIISCHLALSLFFFPCSQTCQHIPRIPAS